MTSTDGGQGTSSEELNLARRSVLLALREDALIQERVAFALRSVFDWEPYVDDAEDGLDDETADELLAQWRRARNGLLNLVCALAGRGIVLPLMSDEVAAYAADDD